MMTKDELHTLAAAGVAAKVAGMERELAAFHKEWPELFLSATAPQLLKAPLKNGTNGHWPPIAPAPAQATRKPIAPAPAKAKRVVKKPRTQILAKRERSARILDAFDEQQPRTVAAIAEQFKIDYHSVGLAPLLNHGYLKRKGDGFVRTKKAFVVNPFVRRANGRA